MGRAAAQRGAKAAASTLREAGRKVVSTAKSAIAAAQSLVSALAAGGSMALVIVIVICLVAALITAPFGLFLSGQTGAGENIQSAMSELVGEYGARIEQIKEETDYDELDIAEDIMSAMMNNRKNVLAVYAVRVTTKDADATEVVTLTDEKKEILRETFFDMNRISWHTTSRTVYSGAAARLRNTVTVLQFRGRKPCPAIWSFIPATGTSESSWGMTRSATSKSCTAPVGPITS